VSGAIRQIGVSEVTYYRWRQKFGGLQIEQVKWLVFMPYFDLQIYFCGKGPRTKFGLTTIEQPLAWCHPRR
jgi:hypothetical protein